MNAEPRAIWMSMTNRTRTTEKGTKEQLLDTAERLFAEHGLEAVSLSRITREAGQRNASALNYHFGSRTELLKALLARRMEGINLRRHEMLDRVDRSDPASALRGIAEALVIPFAEQVDQGGRHYVRLVAQLHGDPRTRTFRLTRGVHDSAIRETAALVPELLPHLPAEIVRQRLVLVTSLIIHSISEQERAMASGASRSAMPLFVGNLIDVIHAMLTAPASAATAGELERLQQAIA